VGLDTMVLFGIVITISVFVPFLLFMAFFFLLVSIRNRKEEIYTRTPEGRDEVLQEIKKYPSITTAWRRSRAEQLVPYRRT